MQVKDLQMIQILQSQEEHVAMQSCMVTLVFQVICKYFEVYRGFKLKIAWIKRIAESSNASWKIIPNQALSKHGGLEFLIECDYDPKLLNLENLPEFYHATTCDKQISIKKKKIWNNRNICIDGKPIYIKSWCISGIRCIQDLWNVNLKFLTLSEMKEKHNFKFPFTTYYGLLRAIPTEWKSALRVLYATLKVNL